MMMAASSSSIESAARISSIFVYPIKSCKGISLPSASFSPTGFRWDRQWLIVNSKGRAYTQRVEPMLALVETELPAQAFADGWEPVPGSYLVLRAPTMDELKIPLWRTGSIVDGVSVWEWTGSACDEGDEASKWFTHYLGKPSRLVRFNAATATRVVDPNYAPGHRTMFADCYPFLLVSQASLDALNSFLQEPLQINRFRPNILVEGCDAFAEDLWAAININGVTFRGVKLCSRCKVPTINQETAVASDEPSVTLNKFRCGRVLRPSKKSAHLVFFGQNLVCEASKGCVEVEDAVHVINKFASHEEAGA